ncbi:MAG: PAS domain-containing protein [Paracoccaceae bacterium]
MTDRAEHSGPYPRPEPSGRAVAGPARRGGAAGDRAPETGGSLARDGDGPAVGAMVRYWSALRGTRDAPLLTEVVPARMDAALPHAYLARRVGARTARLRLAGAALRDAMGFDPVGMTVDAFLVPEARPAFAMILRRAFDEVAAVRIALIRAGGEADAACMLVLPLREGVGGTGPAPLAIGVIDAARASVPSRFRLDPVERPVVLRAESAPRARTGAPSPAGAQGPARLRLVSRG